MLWVLLFFSVVPFLLLLVLHLGHYMLTYMLTLLTLAMNPALATMCTWPITVLGTLLSIPGHYPLFAPHTLCLLVPGTLLWLLLWSG